MVRRATQLSAWAVASNRRAATGLIEYLIPVGHPREGAPRGIHAQGHP